jgi:hypothetical protein
MALASASPAAPTGGVLCQPSVGDRPSELTKCKKTNGSAYTALAIGIAAGKRWKTQGGSKSGAMEQIGAGTTRSLEEARETSKELFTGKLATCKQWLGRKSGLGSPWSCRTDAPSVSSSGSGALRHNGC